MLNKNWTAKGFDVYGSFELLNSELKTSVERTKGRSSSHSCAIQRYILFGTLHPGEACATNENALVS